MVMCLFLQINFFLKWAFSLKHAFMLGTSHIKIEPLYPFDRKIYDPPSLKNSYRGNCRLDNINTLLSLIFFKHFIYS